MHFFYKFVDKKNSVCYDYFMWSDFGEVSRDELMNYLMKNGFKWDELALLNYDQLLATATKYAQEAERCNDEQLQKAYTYNESEHKRDAAGRFTFKDNEKEECRKFLLENCFDEMDNFSVPILEGVTSALKKVLKIARPFRVPMLMNMGCQKGNDGFKFGLTASKGCRIDYVGICNSLSERLEVYGRQHDEVRAKGRLSFNFFRDDGHSYEDIALHEFGHCLLNMSGARYVVKVTQERSINSGDIYSKASIKDKDEFFADTFLCYMIDENSVTALQRRMIKVVLACYNYRNGPNWEVRKSMDKEKYAALKKKIAALSESYDKNTTISPEELKVIEEECRQEIERIENDPKTDPIRRIISRNCDRTFGLTSYTNIQLYELRCNAMREELKDLIMNATDTDLIERAQEELKELAYFGPLI